MSGEPRMIDLRISEDANLGSNNFPFDPRISKDYNSFEPTFN